MGVWQESERLTFPNPWARFLLRTLSAMPLGLAAEPSSRFQKWKLPCKHGKYPAPITSITSSRVSSKARSKLGGIIPASVTFEVCTLRILRLSHRDWASRCHLQQSRLQEFRTQKITAEVNVPQSRSNYTALEPPIIETPQLRDMGEATPPLEWIGLHRDRLPNLTHQIVIVTLLELASEVEDA